MDSFFGIGIFELIIIAIIALVVMGPERLPGAMREMSKYARMIRDLSSDLQSQFGEELQMLDEMNPKRIVNDLLTPTTPAPPAKGSAPATAAKPAATGARCRCQPGRRRSGRTGSCDSGRPLRHDGAGCRPGYSRELHFAASPRRSAGGIPVISPGGGGAVSKSTRRRPTTEEHSMTLMDHLRELRTRLIWVVSAVIIGMLVSVVFVSPMLEFILRPLTATGAVPIAIGPTDTLVVFFKVSLTAGAILAMPVIIYQVIAFISPGLYPNEKRNLLLTLPGAMVLFAIGASFAFFLLVPAAVSFLQGFLGDLIRQDWTIERYISFVTRLVFWIGVAFEMPLVVAFLARIGVISGPTLLGWWRQALVVMAIVAAAITPTVDPVNMGLVMGPLIVLYFGSVGLAYLVYRPRLPRDFSSEDFIPAPYRDDDTP